MSVDAALLQRVVQACAPLVARWAAESPECRAAIRALGELLTQLGSEPVATTPVAPHAFAGSQAPDARAATAPPSAIVAPPAEFVPAPAPIHGPRLDPEYVVESLRASGLYRGQTTQVPPVESVSASALELDLAKTERKARVKADACAFAVKRQRHLSAGGSIFDLRAEYASLRAQSAELMPCVLWMIRDPSELWDDAILERARRWYQNVADALTLTRDHLEDDPEGTLKALAEAQSGLRSALEPAPWEDRDVQLAVYMWIREQGRMRRIYMPRFLAVDAAADPETFAECQTRIQALRARFDARERHSRERHKALNKFRYKVKELDRLDDSPSPEHWRSIDDSLAACLSAGARPDDDDIRAAARPLLDREPPQGFDMSEPLAGLLDALEDARDDAEPSTPARALSPEVLAVRRVLSGTSLVLVGGVPKPKREAALREAFDLADVLWLTDDTFKAPDRFEPVVRRPQTRVVILMVRWSRHAYEALRQLCEKHRKMYLRLPAGYSPNQIAHHLVKQHPDSFGGLTPLSA